MRPALRVPPPLSWRGSTTRRRRDAAAGARCSSGAGLPFDSRTAAGRLAARAFRCPQVLGGDGSLSAARVHLVSRLVEPHGPRQFSWRMVGANNRPVALGSPRHLSAAGCLDDLGSLRRRLAGCRLLVLGREGGWVWRAELDGTVVAESARSYQRRREAATNGELFLALLPTAVADASVRVVPPQRGVARPGVDRAGPLTG
jgi:hypothetical protein